VPAPVGSPEKPLRALVFDSKYDPYKGVLAYVRVVDGEIKKEDKLFLMVKKVKAEALEVGRFRPQLEPDDKLETGQIGYVATGLRSVEECRVGDTITSLSQTNADKKQVRINMEKIQRQSASSQRESALVKPEPLPGYKEVRPMVYASFYPQEGEDYNQMRDALEKLKLNDAALTFEGESSLALGRGFRLGFLGLLHLEIIQERLKREFGFRPVITTPSVVYEVIKTSNKTEKIYSASEMPDAGVIKEIREPYAGLEILTPAQYLGDVMKLVGETTRSSYLSTEYIDKDRVSLKFNSPLSEIIVNFHDALKSVSKGFASMNYEISDYKPYDLVRLDVYVAEEKVDAFAQIVPREKAFSEGRKIVKKLKEVIPRQNFMIKLQAAIGGKVIARESISAFRKDVTGHLYGGDITRKRKLLEKQKKGKKRMTASGRAHIPQEAFLKVLKN
jgi:GTP-binding protein LepA